MKCYASLEAETLRHSSLEKVILKRYVSLEEVTLKCHFYLQGV